MSTVSPVFPELGVTDATLRFEDTVKLMPLLAAPPTDATTFPVVAPEGTLAMIRPSVQVVGVAVVPLNLRVLVPCEDPKPAPAIVTVAPIPPLAGEMLSIPGPAVTVKVGVLLEPVFKMTATGPVVPSDGTGTLMRVELQLIAEANSPLNVTTLAPCVDPKFEPVMLTRTPAGPEAGERLVMLGAVTMVKCTPALA